MGRRRSLTRLNPHSARELLALSGCRFLGPSGWWRSSRRVKGGVSFFRYFHLMIRRLSGLISERLLVGWRVNHEDDLKKSPPSSNLLHKAEEGKRG